MKYIKRINEYLTDDKRTYLLWLRKAILKDVYKLNVHIDTYDDIRTYGFSFYLQSKTQLELDNDIKNIMRILRHWKKYTLENDNIILIIGYVDFRSDNSAKFIISYKTLKIKRVKPLHYVYHQTKKENLESILKDGLIPKDSSKWVETERSLEYPPAIFANNLISVDKYNLFHSRNQDYITLKIDTTKIKNIWYSDLNLTGDSKISKDNPSKYIMTFDKIPPFAIELVDL